MRLDEKKRGEKDNKMSDVAGRLAFAATKRLVDQEDWKRYLLD